MVTLLNQRMTTPQGNVNPGLYKLAQTTPSAFHDIDTGGNWMPCQPGTPDCPDGGLLGYSAGRGYDMVNGIGSIDASRIVTGWPITPQAATPQPAVPQAVATPRTGAQSTTPNAPAAAAAAPAPAAPPSPAVSLPIVALSRTSSPKPVIASVYGGGITWGSNSGNDGPFTQPVVITGTNLPENAAAYVNSPCENLGGRQALSTVWKNSGEIVANITIGCSGTYSIILIDPQSGEKLSAPATLVVPPAE
jgi:hypothetical protein